MEEKDVVFKITFKDEGVVQHDDVINHKIEHGFLWLYREGSEVHGYPMDDIHELYIYLKKED